MTKVPIRESEIVKAILEYLKLKGIYCFRNNTGAFKSVYKGKQRFHRYGEVGSSDIIGITKKGLFLAIEVKRPGGKPTDKQIEFMGHINRNGGIAFVAYSVDDVEKTLISAG
jgi:hypothetical protein